MRMSLRLVVFSVTLLSTVTAHAGNDDAMLIGDDAALMGGAVTAIVGTGAGLWYNPAGLLGVAENTLDLSGSAYSIRLYRTPGLLRTVSGPRADANVNEIVVVPTTLSYVRPIHDGLRIGFGVFVPRSQDWTLRTTVNAPQPDGGSSDWLLTVGERISEYHAIGGLAWQAHPTLRIGFAFKVLYRSESVTAQFAGAQSDPMTGRSEDFITASTLISTSGVGVALSTGLQWRPVEGLAFGLSVRSPLVYLQGSARTSDATSVGIGGFADSTNSDTSTSGFGFDPAQPTRIRAGVAYDRDGLTLSVDGDYQHALTNRDLEIERAAVFNIRVGVRYRLSETLVVGGGFFTDRSATPRVTELGESRLQFYGGTFGISYDKVRRLDQESESVSRLLFGSTFALRYAYGSGHTGGLLLDDAFATGTPITETRISQTVHEISLYLGTRFRF